VILACLVAGILIIIGWIVVELRVPDPAADLRFLFRPRLLPIYIVGIAIYFGDVGGQVTLSTYLSLPQNKLGYGLGLDAFEISVAFIPMRAAAAVMAMLTARLGRIFGFRWVMAAGAAMAALGAFGYPVFHATATGFVSCAVIFLAGFGLIEGSTRTMVVSNLRRWEISMGQGIYEMCAVSGGAIGAATLGAILGANTAAGRNVPTEHGYMLAWSSVAALALVATIVAVIYAAVD
jgi:Na+/melibiose symporter-like transporter